MSLHVTNKEVQKRIKQLGYKGCKNCENQIAPLRMCANGLNKAAMDKCILYVQSGIKRSNNYA